MKKLFVFLMIVTAMLLFAVPIMARNGMIEEVVLPSTVAIVTPMGFGAGVIADETGYIVTARHVVEGHEYVDVYMSDFEQYRGRVVGYHSECDIAIVKIIPLKELEPFHHPEFTPPPDNWSDIANPRQTFIGDEVFAIGHPVGLVWSVTKGIIVQNRMWGDEGLRYIQTDAATNPGNSGGPLVNINGQVIGIIIQGIPPAWAENVGIAITVLSFAEEVGMLIEEDRKRMTVIADVRAYIEGEESEEKKPQQIIITLPDNTITGEE